MPIILITEAYFGNRNIRHAVESSYAQHEC